METLTKLRPDRELQCYFQQPSAVAAISEATDHSFRVSGCWRQQFDWAVIEWNRDNVFEHPSLRNLPDGDLSGIRLSYEEARTNCVAIDSTAYDPIGWSCIRIWENSEGGEHFHKVSLKSYATPLGEYTPASAEFELRGLPTPGDYVELSWLGEHVNWLVTASDTLQSIVEGLATFINTKEDMKAVPDGPRLLLTYLGAPGENGNRVGIYGGVSGAQTEEWNPQWRMFGGGTSPQRWKIDLDFSRLMDSEGKQVPTSNVRRVRWTWAAQQQPGAFERTEFEVEISNWQVSGSGLRQMIAGPGSRRIEDDSPEIVYTGPWTEERGNYSGGSIHKTSKAGAKALCTYTANTEHSLYLGTRYSANGATVTVSVDDVTATVLDLKRALEDVLIRAPIGRLPAGRHSVVIAQSGVEGEYACFDFVEIALPSADLPEIEATAKTTLATDWDTDHSLAIAPERTAWLVNALGYRGRANHYAGAMWFYEIANLSNRYASVTIEFTGTPEFSTTTTLTIAGAAISRTNLITDSAESVAKCFEMLITAGSSAVWAQADGSKLKITAREMGTAGNDLTISVTTNAQSFVATTSQATLVGGIDGVWHTDLAASPRLNRAARDWTRSYVAALKGYGIDCAVAFSMELRDGDDNLSAGIAQRYPDRACRVSTPALQTNFGPESTQFWRDVYRDAATVMSEAGVRPYLQFGEVQWWYFADGTGMPFYDEYTRAIFEQRYGRPLPIIASERSDPAVYTPETTALSRLIGEFTTAIIGHVREVFPDCRFEVLYPPDTNDTPLCRAVNYPAEDWTPAAIDCLKTENFTFTGNRDLDRVRASIDIPAGFGFPPQQRSHLIGIGDYTTPWIKEWQLSLAAGVESIVLFALDQYCLIGYQPPLSTNSTRAAFMGTA